MKKRILWLYVVLFSYSSTTRAQDISPASISNDAEHPCITAQEYAAIEARCAQNIKQLGLEGTQRSLTSVGLAWPLRPANNLTDCSYYHIAAYVDQDVAVGTFHDFNCGTNTYDGHHGTDIATWPFNFYKMDNSLVEVIAAAAGTIIDKHDGEFDRNCSSNNLTANYVVIQHADGSRALYWHMKNGAVTSVAIGQPVAAGDYLGVVGASGSASGPHLHFEIWSGSTAGTYIDPYSGTCNTLNATSWWIAQKPYKETGVIRASSHTTDIVLPPCPTTETLNEGPSFQIPFQGVGLSPGYAKFYIFIRDEINGLTANLTIRNPNNTPYLSWTYTSTSDNKVRVWGWSKLLPTVSGTYTFEAIYNNITCSSTFDIVNPAGVASIDGQSGIEIFPNPATEQFTIYDLRFTIEKIEIYSSFGEKVFSQQSTINKPQTIDVSQLLSGIYFITITDQSGNKVTKKVVKM
jgi:murein DD-endopeptidase MepM/ murein hydrolase activator NlpD